MGGNVEFVIGISKFGADPIPVMNYYLRRVVINSVFKIIFSIRDDMRAFHLANDFISAYDPCDADSLFSGSTAILFSGNDWGPLEKIKPYLGDIDVKINQVHEKSFLNYLAAIEKSNGNLIGFQKSGDNIITLWYIQELNINMQIDFECVEFEDGKPQEWEKFYRSSNIEDLEEGLRGAFHKYMLRAITARRLHQAVTYTPVKKIRKVIQTTNIAVSPRGVRIPYKRTDYENDIPVYVPNKESYEKNVNAALSIIFETPIVSDDSRSNSFIGLCTMCRTHYNDKDRKKILDGLIHSLFERGSQSFFKNDPARDLNEKMHAVKVAAGILKVELKNDLLPNQ